MDSACACRLKNQKICVERAQKICTEWRKKGAGATKSSRSRIFNAAFVSGNFSTPPAFSVGLGHRGGNPGSVFSWFGYEACAMRLLNSSVTVLQTCFCLQGRMYAAGQTAPKSAFRTAVSFSKR